MSGAIHCQPIFAQPSRIEDKCDGFYRNNGLATINRDITAEGAGIFVAVLWRLAVFSLIDVVFAPT
jgi:hypothetical protein